MHSLDKLFCPGSVAIMGASSNPTKTGYKFFDYLLRAGYQGKIFPINPKGGEAFDHTFYKSIADVEEKVDVVLNLISTENTIQSMDAIGKSGAEFMVLFTAGFAEAGEEGAARQKQLIESARSNGIRIVGPNCMGVANTHFGLNLSDVSKYKSGPVGFISQSGNVGITAHYESQKYDIGYSKLVFFGNQADIKVHEYLEYFGEDEETKVIAMYLEGMGQGLGKAFVDVAKKVSQKKPIVFIKGGRTPNGVRAAMSHTASLAGEAGVYSSMLRQAGIIEVESLNDLIPAAETLARCPLCKGRNIAAIGSGGGHSILSVDALEMQGFKVPPMSPGTVAKIASNLPYYAPVGNPVDMVGDFTDDISFFAQFTEEALNDPEVRFDAAINYAAYDLIMRDPGEVVKDKKGVTFDEGLAMVGEVQRRTGKPIIAYSSNARDKKSFFTAQREAGIPTYDSLEMVAKCMDVLYKRNQILETVDFEPAPQIMQPNPSAAIFDAARVRPAKNLTEAEVFDFMKINGVAAPDYRLAGTADEAVDAAEALGYPVVMKISSPDIIHKSDVGGVVVGINGPREAEEAYKRIMRGVKEHKPDAECGGVIVAPMVKGGVELIVGIVRDPFFGPLLMTGIGGVLAEFLGDVQFLSLPASKKEIAQMLKRLKSYRVLRGIRGSKPIDFHALEDLLYQIGQLAGAYPEIAEMDLNPVLALPDKVVIADARIIAK